MATKEKIGPFILGQTLGEGSTGKVKLAVHKDTGQNVAIKIINKTLLTTKPSLRRKVEREIAVMKLISHPHIIRLYDVLQTKKYLFLIIEHVEGGELFDYIVQKGRLTMEEAFHFFRQIINGVDYCHKMLICHRDLKPENLLLDKNKNIKIADFGMASLMEEGKMLLTSCGSPHYASPEVVRGDPYSGTEADIWSLGVILYALLTGRLPFDDDNLQILLSKVKAGTFQMPSFLPQEVQDLITKMLTLDPKKRVTIKQIKQHPWWKKMAQQSGEKEEEEVEEDDVPEASEPVAKEEGSEVSDASSSTTTSAQEEVTPRGSKKRTPSIAVPAEQIDDEVFQSVVGMGWKDEQKLKEALTNESTNIEKVLYRLLLQRKKENGTTKLDSFSPNESVSPQNPILDEGEVPNTGAASVSSPSGIPVPGKLKPGEERLTPPQAIMGSSPKQHRGSWFAFWKKKPTVKKEEPKTLSSTFGLHSLKTQQEIVNELARSFKVLQIGWSRLSETTIRAKCSENDNPVEFDISMSALPNDGGFLLNFSRVSGDAYTARVLFDVLQQEIKI